MDNNFNDKHKNHTDTDVPFYVFFNLVSLAASGNKIAWNPECKRLHRLITHMMAILIKSKQSYGSDRWSYQSGEIWPGSDRKVCTGVSRDMAALSVQSVKNERLSFLHRVLERIKCDESLKSWLMAVKYIHNRNMCRSNALTSKGENALVQNLTIFHLWQRCVRCPVVRPGALRRL